MLICKLLLTFRRIIISTQGQVVKQSQNNEGAVALQNSVTLHP